MYENKVDVVAGGALMTEDGYAVVLHVDRAGVELRDSRHRVSFVEWPDLGRLAPIEGGAPAGVAALRSFAEEWNRFNAETAAEAMFRLGIVNETLTAFRFGHPELALPGEPSPLFDPALEPSLAERARRMAERLSHEAATSRSGTSRGPYSTRTVQLWVERWTKDGLLGLVDGRRAKRFELFATLPLKFRQAAHKEVAAFDGDVSTVNLREIQRRIKVRLKDDGFTGSVPQRAAGRFVAHLMRSRGTTTRAQKSNKARQVAGRESYAALVPGQVVAIDVTRSDVLVWCPVRGGACSVEIISAMDVASRMILALRVVPLSADARDAALLMYDVMRPFSQLVEGTTVSDWAWAGVPQEIEFYSDTADADPDCSGVEVVCPRSCRRVRTAPGLQGEHTIPGVRPSAVRADHGSIFVSQVFRELLARFGTDLPLSRTRRPIDNGILERYHETLQRGLQQLPGYKGRDTSECGRTVGRDGSKRDGALLTAPELERFLRRWIALDYHRSPHDGLHLSTGEPVDLRPIDMFDALLSISGRLHVPQRPDLIYDFLPVRWGTVGSTGVELSGLTYDSPEFDGLRAVPVGTFRAQDAAMPFLYDPHDVTRIWFRHPATSAIVQVPWRKAHLTKAPLTESLLQHVRGEVRRRQRGPRLPVTVAEDEIIAELGNLLDGIIPKDWRKRISAARQRYDTSRRDHTEAEVAMTVAEIVAEQRKTEPAPAPAPHGGDTFSIWADSWPFTPPEPDRGDGA
ncbi:DDE-type integrase/transposase/recombinase [Cellulosimicrobium composti]|uniref:Transposase n=1 Tax=Cellulosimicrobium composti TaxID=2672572 RepID=A0ABX0BDE1_9MICO|nr:DDE-type integrase/transposase/recombinase [Cellulosimicrobium composti]NDO90137.1 transposase [Cellulosimicrobium composti]